MPQIDLCRDCASQLRACLGDIDRQHRLSHLCLGCGDEYFCHAPRTRVSSLVPSDIRLMAGFGDRADTLASDEEYCETCALHSGVLLRQIVAPYRYVYPVDRLIKRVKYRQDRQLARVLGTLLGDFAKQRIRSTLPDALVPMPLHPARLRQRGFNQALDIARWAGRQCGVSVLPGHVTRLVDTGSLAGLGRQERQHRILGAFRASDALYGRHVAIVDDVLTTGASARELARELYDCGADAVELWVLARTSSLRCGA